jgi:hypothetical protein
MRIHTIDKHRSASHRPPPLNPIETSAGAGFSSTVGSDLPLDQTDWATHQLSLTTGPRRPEHSYCESTSFWRRGFQKSLPWSPMKEVRCG